MKAQLPVFILLLLAAIGAQAGSGSLGFDAPETEDEIHVGQVGPYPWNEVGEFLMPDLIVHGRIGEYVIPFEYGIPEDGYSFNLEVLEKILTRKNAIELMNAHQVVADVFAQLDFAGRPVNEGEIVITAEEACKNLRAAQPSIDRIREIAIGIYAHFSGPPSMETFIQDNATQLEVYCQEGNRGYEDDRYRLPAVESAGMLLLTFNRVVAEASDLINKKIGESEPTEPPTEPEPEKDPEPLWENGHPNEGDKVMVNSMHVRAI